VPIFGLNYKDERAAAVQWLQRLGNPYRLNIFDFKGSLGLDLGVYGAPETYVIDAQGIIRYRHVGILDAKVWREKIEPLGLQWAVAQAQGAAL
jgi:cytochrome c biogenesis protein CcmG/thiol:disulfide interchange protein DsbE